MATRLTVRAGALALTMLAAGLAAGCGPKADEPAANGVSADEADALNDAGTMLDNGDAAVVVTNADEGAGNVE